MSNVVILEGRNQGKLKKQVEAIWLRKYMPNMNNVEVDEFLYNFTNDIIAEFRVPLPMFVGFSSVAEAVEYIQNTKPVKERK